MTAEAELWILSEPPPLATTRVVYGPDTQHFADLYLPEGRGVHPVIVGIHGGFWRAKYDLAHFGHAAAALARAGFAVFSLEYRRIGQEGGGCPGTLHDVARGTDFLREVATKHSLDLKHVLTLGHSAGGQLALWLAARNGLPDLRGALPQPLHGVVALAPVCDLVRAWELRLGDGVVETFMGATPSAAPDRYKLASPAARLPLKVPQRLLHGSADDSVPIALSEGYVRAGKSAGDDVELIRMEGAGHFDLINPRSASFGRVVKAAQGLIGSR